MLRGFVCAGEPTSQDRVCTRDDGERRVPAEKIVQEVERVRVGGMQVIDQEEKTGTARDSLDEDAEQFLVDSLEVTAAFHSLG
jgi:hypothetical protein